MDDRKNAIEVEDVHLSYQCLQAFPLRKSIFSLKKSKVEKYEALRGISFGVKKGEIVGVIGRNGSGKSTLLKAIAGIFAPDQGTITLATPSVSLLSIGVGFQRKLTGRENVMRFWNVAGL